MCWRRVSTSALGSLLVLVIADASAAQGTGNPGTWEADVASFIERTLTAEHVPGAQVAAVAGGRLIWSRGYGFANVGERVAVEPGTVFRAASVSKLFTATLVMRQVEAGRVGLDDRVNDYLEPPGRLRDRDGNEAPVTIRQLLSHSSGLAVSWLPWASVRAYLFGGPQPTFEDNVSGGFVLTYPPGQRIVYANPGYWLLGRLAARLTGEPFEAAVANGVLAPLGMTSSDFRPLPALTERQAVPYRRSGDDFEPVLGPRALPVNPAASLLTTAEDLARFAGMVIENGETSDGRLLAPETLAEMRRLQVRQDPALETGYGLGFMVGQHRGRAMIWHDGGDPGVSTRLAILPAERIAVAVLMNASTADAPQRVATRVLDALLGDAASFDVAHARRQRMPPAWRRQSGTYRAVDSVPPGLALLQFFAPFRVEASNGVLRMRGNSFLPLDAVLEPTDDDGVYVLHGDARDGERVVFRDTDGNIDAYLEIIHLRRIPPYLTPGVLILSTVAAALLVLFTWLRRRARSGKQR